MTRNPYRWDGPMPGVNVVRSALVHEACRRLVEGQGVLMLAGRGMGKSVFLAQLETALAAMNGVKVVRLPEPPVLDRTIEGCMRALADALGVPREPLRDVRAMVREVLAERPELFAVCLLYDEVDQYNTTVDGEPLSRRLFNHLETARKELGCLGVVAVGGIGLFWLRSVDASPFVSRATRLHLAPFTREEMRELVAPFAAKHHGVGEDFLDALSLMSGGNPALAVYGLQTLWSHPGPALDALREAYARFHDEQREFVRVFRKSVSDALLSDAPAEALAAIWKQPGAIPVSTLRKVCREAAGEMRLDPPDVIEVLECAGLARREGSLSLDPLCVWPVATVMNLHESARTADTLRAQLRADLTTVLQQLHTLAADFFRAPKTGGKELVPESVFSAFVTLALRLLGWSAVEREALQVSGRTDVKATHPRFRDEVAVIELKIWGRNDYREIHQQVVGYWSATTCAAAAVMITDATPPSWESTYTKDCLGVGVAASPIPTPAMLHAAFEAHSNTDGGVSVRVEHYLLRLPRG